MKEKRPRFILPPRPATGVGALPLMCSPSGRVQIKRRRLKVRFRNWQQVEAFCDSAEIQPVSVEMPASEAPIGDSVTAHLLLPDGLTAKVAGVISDFDAGVARVALIGMTSALIERLRALSAPAEEAVQARGSGPMKVSELLRDNRLLRAQIDALAAKMKPHK